MLNLDDLQVEELEQRVELATLVTLAEGGSAERCVRGASLPQGFHHPHNSLMVGALRADEFELGELEDDSPSENELI